MKNEKKNNVKICDQKTAKPQFEKLDRTCDHHQVKLYTKIVDISPFAVC